MDFALDDSLDLSIVNGDFEIIEDDRAQRAGLILRTYPGNWKQWPRTGLGKASFINAPIEGHLRRKISMQLAADNLSADGTYMVEAIDILVK
jgi:hypothetical protein